MTSPADAQRERAVAILKRAYAEGRLEHDEFETRAAAALAARSRVELHLQLRGLVADDVRRRARRAARFTAIIVVWLALTVFLAIAGIVALVATHASLWTLAFPAAWVAITALAVRDARRLE
jgi:Domain of unknown function (DUF1707)